MSNEFVVPNIANHVNIFLLIGLVIFLVGISLWKLTFGKLFIEFACVKRAVGEDCQKILLNSKLSAKYTNATII